MNITIRNSYEKSHGADLTVFIDIFRASTTLSYLIQSNAEEIVGLNDYELIKEHIDNGYTLVSEVFDDGMDNSPSQVLKMDLTDKKIVLKTGNLVTAIFNNLGFTKAIVCGFVNLDRVVTHIQSGGFSSVEIVAAANCFKNCEAVEDSSCAIALKEALLGKPLTIPRRSEIDAKIERKKRVEKWPDHYYVDLALALKPNSVSNLAEINEVSTTKVVFSPLS